MATANKRYVKVQAYDLQLDNGGGEKTPAAVVSLRVVEGPDTGLNLTWYGYLSEKAAPYTMKGLRALGWTGTKVSKAMSEGLGTLKADACLKTEDGRKEKVDGIFEPRGNGTKNPVDAASLDAFDALFEDFAVGVEPIAARADTKAGELPAAVARKAKPAVENPNELGF